MSMLIEATLRALQRTGGDRGQVDALVIALLIFLFILIISDRRLFVQ
ncbi:MAG TPA: hypothetical protein VFM39_07515 [bacterium]|nr:hypothetical protein [bacterium]